jgi:NADH-quinone oxidoreductase subunit A
MRAFDPTSCKYALLLIMAFAGPTKNMQVGTANRIDFQEAAMLQLATMNSIIPLGIMAVLAGAIALMFILGSVFLGPKKRHPVKDSPFECGIASEGYDKGPMPIRFYVMAMLFIIFDVELAFLFPWSVVFRTLGLFGFLEMLVFFIIVGVGFIYAWKIGALEWD